MDKNNLKRALIPSSIGAILGVGIGLGTKKNIGVIIIFSVVGVVGGYFIANIGKWGKKA